MKQCPNGHIFDEKRNGNCPYCMGKVSVGVQNFNEPMAVQPDFPKTVPISGGGEEAFPATMPADINGGSDSMSVTIALDETEAGIAPVRGWLVAVDGDKTGMSFNIHGEQNSVGRGHRFDINLNFDKAVSSDGNAVIAYDSQNRKFFISPILGKGKNNIYLNDSILLMPMELKDYDKIKFGTSTYVFRSFCNEEFTY